MSTIGVHASTHQVAESAARRSWRRTAARWGAVAWSLAYAWLHGYWALGGAGFPYGADHDSAADLTWFAHAQPEKMGPAVAVLALAGAAVAAAMARGVDGRAWRHGLLGFAWLAAAVLALLLPDYRVLMVVAYTPILLVGVPLGLIPLAEAAQVWTPTLATQLFSMVGGGLWAAAAVTYARRTSVGGRGWTPASAARGGRWATGIAVAVPIVYAVTRLAWMAGVPLGISNEFLEQMRDDGMLFAGASLGLLAVGGAVLTLGLVQRWGEVFPRWMPVVRDRRVPPMLAVVPAMAVAVLVTSAGTMFVRLAITGGLPEELSDENALGALGPELLWPLWGPALAVAALAYHRRRRGAVQGSR